MAAQIENAWEARRNPRIVSAMYLLVLVLVATIALLSNRVTAHIVEQQASTARVVDLAGRQRMLGQRTARFAEELSAGTVDVAEGRAAVLESAEGMEEAETALMHGSTALAISAPASAALRALYTEPRYRLQTRIADFVGHARHVAERDRLDAGDPDLRALRSDLETSLMPGLEHAALQYRLQSEAAIAHLQRVNGVLAASMMAVLALGGVLVYRPLIYRLTRTVEDLLQAQTTDMLTRVLNRSAFLQHAEAELANARRTGAPVALMMADLDNCKQVNDRHGHAAGDLALRHFTAIVQSNLRSNDRIGRVGGEEFAILLSGTELAGAVLAAERIRERLAGSTAALMSDNFRVFVTCSLGVTVAAPGESLPDLLARADALLYLAKNAGRNRVESAEPALFEARPGAAQAGWMLQHPA